MRRLYAAFCKAKDVIAMALLAVISTSVFVSAVARTLKHPVNWAQDLSLLLFAWLVFLGADMVLRRDDFISVEMIVQRLPGGIREVLYHLWYAIILAFLGALVRFGLPLCFQNSKRLFQTLGISYSWATASVPVGSAFLAVTICVKLWKRRRGLRSGGVEARI